jgi:adenylate kinase
MNKYILMGPPGAGKSTQAANLSRALGGVHISVGAILRWNVKHCTKLGLAIKDLTQAGEFVSDEVVEHLVKSRLEQHDWNYGFVLDGYPRNATQARSFLASYDINALIVLKVPDVLVLERLMNSRYCNKCQIEYNLLLAAPRSDCTCDLCGGPLTYKENNRPEVVRVRLADYHQKTEPMLELFKRKERVITIDATQDPAQVQENIQSEVGLTSVSMLDSLREFEDANRLSRPSADRKPH